jgi:hypothetical protein
MNRAKVIELINPFGFCKLIKKIQKWFFKFGFCKILSEVKLTLTGILLGWVTLPQRFNIVG